MPSITTIGSMSARALGFAANLFKLIPSVYTVNNGNGTVSKITTAGVVTQAWATLASGAAPVGIAIK